MCGFFAITCDAANYTVRLNTGVNDPVLGTSYIQFAMKGLAAPVSQGSGSWTVEPGDRFTHYKLVDSVVDSPKDKDGHEQDFFDGIDTTLPGFAARLGDEEKKAPWLRKGLAISSAKIDEASCRDGERSCGSGASLAGERNGLESMNSDRRIRNSRRFGRRMIFEVRLLKLSRPEMADRSRALVKVSDVAEGPDEANPKNDALWLSPETDVSSYCQVAQRSKLTRRMWDLNLEKLRSG